MTRLLGSFLGTRDFSNGEQGIKSKKVKGSWEHAPPPGRGSLYDKKVEGIIIPSRARWHEHGEKNSKYFNIKKHIRKLFVSGAISTDPLEILNTEKRFYEKL